jgi:alpha-galactosidase
MSNRFAIGFCLVFSASAIAADPAYWAFALTPPMGWNSYDSFGDSVTEAEIMANATYLHDHLQSHGWQYVVVDFRWYDPGANSGNPNDRLGATLSADEYGRLIPAPNRFPSGFAAMAKRIHDMGLKFGIHVMRGIPRQSVAANTPIEGSSFHAADAANSANKCVWCPDMFGVRGDTDAGRAWYDSIVRQYAQWGVDYIKVDDLSNPYSSAEIEALRSAIDKQDRPIVLSLSPGETPVSHADHVRNHANLWRISNDFWDRWRFLDRQFDLIARWQGVGGPGHWPDADMIPLGHIAQRCGADGPDRHTRFTRDEQATLMSMWAIAPSPLMLGMNLPDDDAWTDSLLTNDEVIAVDQDRLGRAAVLMGDRGPTEIWKKDLSDGSVAVGLFNRTGDATDMNVPLTGKQTVRDLWLGKDLGVFDELRLSVPRHGARLLRIYEAHG